MNDILIQIFVFLTGAIVGSFLNVCIYRMPREQSVVKPRSFCPQCRAPIPWQYNIPLISYLFLRGKCFSCKKSIPARYFVIELITALSWLLLWAMFGCSVQFVIGAVFISSMIAVTATDLETGLIPDQITLFGMAAGLCLSTVNTGAFPDGLWYHKLLASFIGLIGGGALLWITGWLGSIIFRKEAMGGGDVKLLAMTGAFIGFEKALLVFMLAPFIALPFAIFYRFVKKSETVPYGPFLALMAALFFLKGDMILELLAKIYGVR